MIDIVKQIFLQVVSVSWKASVIVLLLLMLTKMIEKRYSAGFRYYSWLAVMLVFLIPFHSFGVHCHIDLPYPALYMQAETEEMLTQVSQTFSTDTIAKETPETEKNRVLFETEKSEGKEISFGRIDIVSFISLIWLSVAVLYFGIHIKRYFFLKKAIKRISFPLSDVRIERILAEEQMRLKTSEKLTVRISPIADTPLLTGLIRGMLILPKTDYNDDELHLILRHELIHYKRKDIWYQFLTLFFVSLHWFNPFAYLMARAVEIDGETSCDEVVLKNNPYETRIFYGEMLIAFLKTKNQKKSYLTTTFFGGEKAMKKRLALIASKKSRKNGIAAMAILIVIAVMLSVVAAASAIKLVDSKDMVKNSSNRENTIIMDTGEGYDVFIGCEPVRENDGRVKVPLKSFIVFVDYKILSEETRENVVLSNGTREIALSANSTVAQVDGEPTVLIRGLVSGNDDFYLYIDDIEALFSYRVSYDAEKNNVVLTVTEKTPAAVKTITPPEQYAEPTKVTVFTQGAVPKLFINDTFAIFPDAQPFVDEENRTQVPVRAFAELLNCKVDWDEDRRRVLISGQENTFVMLTMGDKSLFVNGERIEMDTVPIIMNGRTYAPLYFLSEALNLNVFWED